MRRRHLFVLTALCLGGTVPFLGRLGAPPRAVSFSQSAAEVDAYDFVELSAQVAAPRAASPFRDASIHGTFEAVGGTERWEVDGFCDAEDGSLYRVRFMPPAPGEYAYTVEYRQGWYRSRSSGTIHARRGGRRGPIRIDPANRWHFVWEGTGEHYFFNGTTAYWLMGWKDESVIQASIDRLSRLKVNRMRVTIAGRTQRYFGEPVMAGPAWTPLLAPWPVGRGQRALHYLGRLGQRSGIPVARDLFDSLGELGTADDMYHPGFDYSRFRVAYWQKFERALRAARDRDVIVSLVLDMNDSYVHPAAGSDDEMRFIRYAVARFGAFSNITWDLGDDLDQYRTDRWTRATGRLIKKLDPVDHLATSHPIDNAHQDRGSDWFDFTSFQEWSRSQHAFMLAQRSAQARLGRIIPQTNEEYGYEDHYPLWAPGPGSESADTLRRTAWDIVMAGGYQTAGESARRGTHVWPDSGGGWMNGRGDDTMTMFTGYAHLVDFFTSFDWWRAEPHDELVSEGAWCLARPGELYAIYLPQPGRVTLKIQPGEYTGTWWNAATGERAAIPTFTATSSWSSAPAPWTDDSALLLRRRQAVPIEER